MKSNEVRSENRGFAIGKAAIRTESVASTNLGELPVSARPKVDPKDVVVPEG